MDGLDNRAMTDDRAPTVFRPGDVTYLHIPCREPLRAADFYEAVFAWKPRRDSDEPAFTDATGHVIGHFIAGEPSQEAGIIPYVYVEDLRQTMTLITDSGGTIAGELRPEGTLQVATFHDPEATSSASGLRRPPDLLQD
jgi:predicted enzyme related to lactoylglutathione lyase